MNLIHQLTPLYTWKLFLFPKIITLCLDRLIIVQSFLLCFLLQLFILECLAYYLVVCCYQIFLCLKLFWQNFLNSCRHSIILLLRFKHSCRPIMTSFFFLLSFSFKIKCMKCLLVYIKGNALCFKLNCSVGW